MHVTAIKTHKITSADTDIFAVLNKYVNNLEESTIVAITSKIISITQGRIVKIDGTSKDELIKQESQYYLPRNENKYNVSLTITNDTLIATAGIDESNGNGYYILWPENPQKSANEIRSFFKKKFNLKNIGVIITDSKTTPLRWGVTAIAIGYSGIMPLKNYIGKKDIFGRNLQYTQMSIIDNVASAAALCMGEGNEQTPIAILSDIQNIEFVDRNPTEQELKTMHVQINEDLYTPLLKSAKWLKGKKV